jgi:hypothetical protein
VGKGWGKGSWQHFSGVLVVPEAFSDSQVPGRPIRNQTLRREGLKLREWGLIVEISGNCAELIINFGNYLWVNIGIFLI